jgi:hypothetical protein
VNDTPRVLASPTSATHTHVRRMNSWLCAGPSALSPTFLMGSRHLLAATGFSGSLAMLPLRHPGERGPLLSPPEKAPRHPTNRVEAVWLGALALYQGPRAAPVAGSDRGHWLVATGAGLTAGGPQSSLVEARGNQRAACATRQTRRPTVLQIEFWAWTPVSVPAWRTVLTHTWLSPVWSRYERLSGRRGTLRLPQSAAPYSIWSIGLCPRSLSLGARLSFGLPASGAPRKGT